MGTHHRFVGEAGAAAPLCDRPYGFSVAARADPEWFAMAKHAVAALALFVALSAGSAAAQQTDEIVVTGSRVEEAARTFAGAVAVAASAEDQYARWNFRMCPSVVGIASAEAQVLIDHIALRAHDVGVEVERAGCNTNLVIVFASDSDRVTREIYDTRRDLLGYYGEDDTVTAGREALQAFVNTPRAVRWWHVARTVTADGQVLGDTRTRVGRGTNDAAAAAAGGGASAVVLGNGFRGAEAVRSGGTRTRRATRQDINYVLIIVDSRRVAGLPTEAVADYVAMASLVQLDPDADMTSFPTVLNLFADREAGRAPIAGMTDWDRAYLQGLYSATREAVNARTQRNEIARRIVDSIAQ